MCSKNAHCPVPIPTHKHSLSHRARAHKTDSDRLRFKHVPTNATLCMSHGFCKNETSVHSLHSSEQCFRCDKCARCPAPTPTHRHDSSYVPTGTTQPSPSRLTAAEESSAGNLR
ncbi:hypothetical protein PO909_003246, partial [Leuciscus waleckii]